MIFSTLSSNLVHYFLFTYHFVFVLIEIKHFINRHKQHLVSLLTDSVDGEFVHVSNA